MRAAYYFPTPLALGATGTFFSNAFTTLTQPFDEKRNEQAHDAIGRQNKLKNNFLPGAYVGHCTLT
jgi:hypothetical protein